VISPGTRVGPYEVSALIGQGGMGEVYRATDLNLKRAVALKVLPQALAADPERLARFQREAEVLASLNHPNIAAVYGLERGQDVTALVMELVDGPTLAERIAPGALAVDDALEIARQIAEALGAAHERGIVHRDLKPANVKVRPDGAVKVLDFGLAKALDGPATADGVSQLPTITTPAMTRAGMIMGTAAYMSPEQARGARVDRRADVWALGCVIYEMLTGRRAFDGDTVSDTLAAVLRGEPDWSALPSGTPASVRRLLRRSLTKDPNRRLADVGDLRLEIEDARVSEPALAVPVAPAAWRITWLTAGALAAVLVAGGAAGTWWLRTPEPVPPAPVRFVIPQPAGVASFGSVRVSPDGRTIGFLVLTDGANQIWTRSLDSPAARRVEGTDGATTLFWSPDSQSIAFASDGRLLVVPVSGGPTRTIATLPARGEYYGSWGVNGDILLSEFSSNIGGFVRAASSGTELKGLLKVPASGGSPQEFRRPDSARNEEFYLFPNFLPDGNRYIFTIRTTGGRFAAHVGSLDSNQVTELPGIESNAIYSTSGHLVFLRNGALTVQRFDEKTLQLAGQAVAVEESIAPPGAPTARVSAASGVIAFLPLALRSDARLVWFDRGGNSLGEAAPPGIYVNPELSKDDRFVAWDEGGGPEGEMWVRDLGRGLTTRLTSAPGNQGIPQWSPDGSRIAYRSDRDGVSGVLVSREFGVVGDETVLLKASGAVTPLDWSLDGRYVAFSRDGDAWLLDVVSGKPIQVTRTPAVEGNVRVSPDGQWLAYQSNEPGAGRPDEIYLHSIADKRRKLQVSTAGGYVPRWRRDGKELYYMSADRTLMAVAIDLSPAQPRIGAPAPLFRARVARGAGAREYAVSSDGRFLISAVEEERRSPSLNVLVSWLDRLH
jgi:eukaryotic-like serine/threonine-protein kinase